MTGREEPHDADPGGGYGRLERAAASGAGVIVAGKRETDGVAALLPGGGAHKLASLAERPVIVAP